MDIPYPLIAYAPGGPAALDPDLDGPVGPGGSCTVFTQSRAQPAVVDELVALGADLRFWWMPADLGPDGGVAVQQIAMQDGPGWEQAALDDDPDQYGDLLYAVRLPVGVEPLAAAQIGFIIRDLAIPSDETPAMSLNLATTAAGRVVVFGYLY
jgi:hypothetical protein